MACLRLSPSAGCLGQLESLSGEEKYSQKIMVCKPQDENIFGIIKNFTKTCNYSLNFMLPNRVSTVVLNMSVMKFTSNSIQNVPSVIILNRSPVLFYSLASNSTFLYFLTMCPYTCVWWLGGGGGTGGGGDLMPGREASGAAPGKQPSRARALR